MKKVIILNLCDILKDCLNRFTAIQKYILILVFIFYNQVSEAQLINVLTCDTIKSTSDGGFFHPVFSPASDFLLCTEMNYKGLKQINLSDKTIKKLTDLPGAGYRVRISDDGTKVLYREVRLNKNLKFTSLNLLSLADGKASELISPTRETFTSEFSANNPFFVKGTKLNRKSVPVAKLKPVIQIEDRKMVLYDGNDRIILTPNGANESYIWPSVSPDLKRIVYTVAGKGTFTSTVNGGKVISLGKLSSPKWLNNNIIVGMDDKYYGQELVSSEIIAASADGKNRQTIISDKAIYPEPSVDGTKIAFSNNSGQLFILNINIK